MTKSIFLKRFSETLQFILGFLIGIALIAGVSGAIVFAYYAKMSVLPKKPVFPAVKSDAVKTEIEPLESRTNELDQEAETAPAVTQEEKQEPEIELPPNAYRAVVTWPEGLSLRAEPNVDAERIGGIEDESTIIILEDSPDGLWQRVRLPENNQEGWIKGGNTEKIP